jgi:hypothetical protein
MDSVVSDLLQYLQAAAAGQVDIEQDEIRAISEDKKEAFFATAGCLHFKSALNEPFFQARGHPRIVFDDENATTYRDTGQGKSPLAIMFDAA